MKLPVKLTSLKPYEPITGSYAVRLDANESCFDLPIDLKEKISAQIEQVPFNRYPDPIATEVVNAFAAYYGISPDCVTAGNGSDEIITLLFGTFLDKGAKLVTVSHDFSMYGVYASLAEIEVTTVQKQPNRQIDMDALIAAAKRADAVIFSNPCNPTSLGEPREAIIRLIEAAPDCMMIVDEAYMDFWDESVLDLVTKYDNLIVLRTCSKMIGLAAVRMGFAVMDERKTALLRAAKSPYNCDAITQTICAAVLRETDLLRHCRDELVLQTQRLYTAACKLQQMYPSMFETVYAPRTNFVFIKTAKAHEIFEKLRAAGIAVRCFPDGLRICAGTRSEQSAMLTELERILQAME